MKTRAHTNIALIKYWGKADPNLRLPLMSSLSMTLDAFYTETSIKKIKGRQSEFYLNGQKQGGPAAERVFTYLRKLQTRFNIRGHFLVQSMNHVPTAAGLASSSSAFAALAGAFNQTFALGLNRQQLSRLARLGSGSACRSVFGGFTLWQKGNDDQSSYAYPIEEHPAMDLHLLAIEINKKPKKISSTAGMKAAQTSPFFQPWLSRNDAEIQEMVSAIKEHDFTKLGELAELNANEMHAVNLTARPPFTYFLPATIKGIRLVQELRHRGIECYYTIDAGPNLKILTQLRNIKEIKKIFLLEFNHVNIVNAGFGSGIEYLN